MKDPSLSLSTLSPPQRKGSSSTQAPIMKRLSVLNDSKVVDVIGDNYEDGDNTMETPARPVAFSGSSGFSDSIDLEDIHEHDDEDSESEDEGLTCNSKTWSRFHEGSN